MIERIGNAGQVSVVDVVAGGLGIERGEGEGARELYSTVLEGCRGIESLLRYKT